MNLTIQQSEEEAHKILELVELSKQKDLLTDNLPPVLRKLFQIGITLIGKAE